MQLGVEGSVVGRGLTPGSACGSGSRTQGGAYLYLAGVTQRAAGEGGGLLLLPSVVYPNLTV